MPIANTHSRSHWLTSSGWLGSLQKLLGKHTDHRLEKHASKSSVFVFVGPHTFEVVGNSYAGYLRPEASCTRNPKREDLKGNEGPWLAIEIPADALPDPRQTDSERSPALCTKQKKSSAPTQCSRGGGPTSVMPSPQGKKHLKTSLHLKTT